MNKKKIILAAGVVLVLAVAGFWIFGKKNAQGKVDFVTEKVTRGNISNSITATGTIEPVTEVEVGTQVSGIIDKIYIDYNSVVKQGEVIAEMDKVTLLSDLQSAQATYNGAKAEYDYQKKLYTRNKALHEKQLISETDYEQSVYDYERAKSTYEQTQAALAKAERNLSYATITSPINGIVTSKDVEEGQTVASGFETPTLFTIAADLTKMQVVADVDEADIAGIKDSARVTFTVDAYPDDIFEGKVYQIRLGSVNSSSSSSTSTSSETVVTYEVVITADNPDLKLKPEVRSKWIYTVMAGGGYGEKALYDASFNALQLSRNRQTVYTYKANNTGRNLFSDQQKLASGNSFDRVTDSNLPIFLPLPEPAMPLSQKRLLFNETHTASANRLYRLDEEKQLRFQLGYIHDRTTRQYGSEEIYYFVQDTVHTATNRHDRLKTDCLNAEVNYEDNTVSRYTRENFSFAGTWKSGVSDITGDNAIFQKIKNSQWELKNHFNQLYTKEKYTWGIRLYIRYTHCPASLTVAHRNLPILFADNMLIANCIYHRNELSSPDNISENTYRTVIGQTHESILAEYEEMNTGNAYTDNVLYGMRKINGVNYQLTGGFCGELSSVKQENAYSAHSYSFYTVPRIEWERNDFLFTAATTVRWSHLPKQSYSRFCVSPFFCFRYKFTPRWKMSLLGSLDESEGGLKDIYPFRYREDYRTVVKHTGKVPVTVRQLYTCYLEYKNTIKEFFWTLSASYSHNRYNLITERNYKDGNFYLSSVERNHSSHSYTLNTIGSKGIYDWNLKTSLELTLARNEGKQLNEGIVQDYRYDYLCIEPKIVWAPSVFFEAEYKATVSCVGGGIGEDTSLDPLWEVAQRLTLSLEFHDTEFRLSGEHFYNDLSKNQHLNIWLADVSLIHKVGKWRFAASAINLFNKEQYRYTLYSAVQSYTSWIKLRPREFMVSVQYQW